MLFRSGSSFNNGNSATYSPTITTTYTLNTSTFTNGITCPYNLTFQIVVNSKPVLTIVPTRTMFCKGETNTLTVNGAQTYTWNGGTNTPSIVISGSVGPTTQIYSVTGTNSNGCVNSSTLAVNISACSGLEKNNISDKVTVYPNPSKGSFNITSSVVAELSISNELGQVIRVINLNEANNFNLVIDNFKPGIYLVSDKDKKVNLKIVVND